MLLAETVALALVILTREDAAVGWGAGLPQGSTAPQGGAQAPANTSRSAGLAEMHGSGTGPAADAFSYCMREPARIMDDDGRGWGFWAGIAVMALIVFLAIVLILPWTEDTRTTSTVEKTTPAPSSTPAEQK